MTLSSNFPEDSTGTTIDTSAKKTIPDRASYRKGRRAPKEVDRLNDVNTMLTVRNEKLQAENTELREALQAIQGGMFHKASEIQTNKDVIISSDKFAELFLILRNNMNNGTEGIVCQLNDQGSVSSIIPQNKTKPNQ